MIKKENKLWYFDNFSLMNTLPLKELIKLKMSTKMKEVRKNNIIYFPTEISNSVFLIKKGKVKISRIAEDGREVIIAVLSPGEIFGESCITDSNLSRDEFAEAMEDTIICSMFSEIIHELMYKNPDFGIKITKIIGFRLKSIQNRFESLIFVPSNERVKAFIKKLAEDNGLKNSQNEIEIKLNLTHDDIGKLTATSRQMVTTVLNDLEKKEIISFNRQKIVVKNLSALFGKQKND